MKWTLQDRGFLPNQDPQASLGDPLFREVERLGMDMSRLVQQRTFRAASADFLAGPIDWNGALSGMEDGGVERLFMLFSYFASAYVHAPGSPPVNRLPSYL